MLIYIILKSYQLFQEEARATSLIRLGIQLPRSQTETLCLNLVCSIQYLGSVDPNSNLFPVESNLMLHHTKNHIEECKIMPK